MRQRVLWGLLALIIVATIGTGHVVLGIAATGVEMVVFDVLLVTTGLGFLVKSKAKP